MAYIREIKNKKGISYKIEVSIGYNSVGNKLRETTTYVPDPTLTPTQQKKALDKFVFEFEQKVINGKYLDGEKLTLKEFSEKWLIEYAKQHLEISTYSSYEKILNQRIIPKLGHMKLNKITPLHLQSFYNEMTRNGCRFDGKSGAYSYGTIKKTHVVISSLMSTGVQWLIINDNPCYKVKLPKISLKQENSYDEKNRFTQAQTKIFLAALDKDYLNHYKGSSYSKSDGSVISLNDYCKTWSVPYQMKLFFYIAIYTGCRKGEILGLRWNEVDFDNNSINIRTTANCIDRKIVIKAPKTKNSIRMVGLPPFVMDMIKKWKIIQTEYKHSIGDKWVGDNWLFIQWNGKLMNVSTPYNTFKSIIEKHNEIVTDKCLKLPPHVTLHGLRHTNASLLSQSNQIDITSISENLGHSKVSTTENYYFHSDYETKQEIARILENMLNEKQA